MRELEKIRSVIQRLIPGAPHEVLLVLDATNGQNAIRQAEVFTKSIGCTGVILTKLDGTAKGGVVVAVRQTMKLPVKFIGVGEAPRRSATLRRRHVRRVAVRVSRYPREGDESMSAVIEAPIGDGRSSRPSSFAAEGRPAAAGSDGSQ